jgi:hypothetical protein
MKYLKNIIDFDKFEEDEYKLSSDEKLIKDIYPIFYDFLKENNLVNKWIISFKECIWGDEVKNIEKILKKYKNELIIINTINWHCAKNKFDIDWSIYNIKFIDYYFKRY